MIAEQLASTDSEIAEIEKLEAELRAKVEQTPMPALIEVSLDHEAVKKRLFRAREERRGVLERGLPPVLARSEVDTATVRAAHRMRRFLSKGALPKAAEPEIALSAAAARELTALGEKFYQPELIEAEFVEKTAGSDAESILVEYSLGLHVGLLCSIARLQAKINANGEFQLLRRREIEERIGRLEDAAGIAGEPYANGREYKAGACVTFDSRHWIATVDNKSCEPGDGAIWRPLGAVLQDDLGSIDQRLKVLEARPQMFDAGVWTEGKLYAKGSVVSFDGSAFVANEETNDRPGQGGPWRLFVKRGRDRHKDRHRGRSYGGGDHV